MKTLINLLLAIILITTITSCDKEVERRSYQDLIETIKKGNVSEIEIRNHQFAFVYEREELDQPGFKVPVGLNPYFEEELQKLSEEYGFNLSQISNNSSSFPLILFGIYPLLFLLYIIGGIICLTIVLKSNFRQPIDKLAWIITLIFVPVIGIILFLIIGRKQIESKR